MSGNPSISYSDEIIEELKNRIKSIKWTDYLHTTGEENIAEYERKKI